ncbi:MAG: hypothetical protein ACD_58C00278G0001 [uncultured bacterium]|nr:MAG: hypothetical protein ACD_58C00278G0001 [uncultured bacterium]
MKLTIFVTKKTIIYLIVIILIIALGTFLLIKKSWQNKSDGQIKGVEINLLDFDDKDNLFKLKYPDDMVIAKLTDEQKKKDQIVFQLVQPKVGERNSVLIEKGLGVVEAFIKQPLLEYMKGNIDLKFGTSFSDYKKEKVEDSKLAGLDAFTVWFTYMDQDKNYRQKIKMSVTVKDKTGYYLICQGPEEIWSRIEPSCDIIKDNFSFIEKQ